MVTTFEIAEEIIAEATSQFVGWKIAQDRYDVFQQYCEVFDKMIEDFDAESVEVEVDDINMTIIVTIECADFTVGGSNSVYFELIKRSESFNITQSPDNNLNLTFVFSSIWEKE